MPPCLSRKPKRAESEIPSLPEAGPPVLSFERQHGKINGHLLREPLGHTVLLPHGQTALGPVVCCCCCCCWVSLRCLLWEDFQPCTAIKISISSLFVCLSLPQSYSPCTTTSTTTHPPPSFQLIWTSFPLCPKAAESVTSIPHNFFSIASQIITISRAVCITLRERGC